MRIDGVPNLRACMEPCRNGTTVAGQNAYPSSDLDVLEAVDWLFPKGMNHHTLMTGSAILNKVVNKVVRQLSGLGELPDQVATHMPPATRRSPDVIVIGGGPAGLAAAHAAAATGADTMLVDEQQALGGSLLGDPRFGGEHASALARAARDAGAELMSTAAAIAFFPEDEDGVLAVASPEGLCRVTARRYVYATGGYAVNRLFVNNDRPGVLAARAVGRLLVRDRVLPGHRVCVVGDDDYAHALARALHDAGSETFLVNERERHLAGVRGRNWVTGVEVVDQAGKRRRIDCDLVAVSNIPAPASDGLRQHGCRVELRPPQGGFVSIVDEQGRTNVSNVFACGDVCGFMGAERAIESGTRAGANAAAEALAEKAAS